MNQQFLNKFNFDRFYADWRINPLYTSGPCPRLGLSIANAARIVGWIRPVRAAIHRTIQPPAGR